MAVTPLSQAILAGMDPNVYGSLQRMQTGDQLSAQGMDSSPTTKLGGIARLAQALSGSYIQNSAASDLAKTIASGKTEQLAKRMALESAAGGEPVAPVPQAPPAMSAAPAPFKVASVGDVAPPVAASGAPVQSSQTTWGDKEAEDAGLYERPKGPPAPQTLAQAPAGVQPSVPTAKTAAGPQLRDLFELGNGPYATDVDKAVAQDAIKRRLTPKEAHSQVTDTAGNIWDVNQQTGQRTVALKKDPAFGAPSHDADGNLVQRDSTGKITVLSAADKTPNSVREYEYYVKHAPAGKPPMDYGTWSQAGDKTPNSVREYEYYKANNNPGQEPMDYATWSTAKARAGATNFTNNFEPNGALTYDKQLAEGLGKSHAALANGLEDAQSRARDLAAMQGAIDAIQKNGGTTGGLGQQQVLDLQKTINSGAKALGIDNPFNENSISDKEFMTKFNRQIAGAQAKNAVGSRVTNFEMSNYLKANPGLDMSVTGNQRLIGIQSQIEQRNIAVGNAIRNATAAAVSKGQRIDPVTVQKIITDYDEQHHVKDPVNGQDLTQSYTLPEFQGADMGSNKALGVGHETNINGIKIRRVN